MEGKMKTKNPVARLLFYVAAFCCVALIAVAQDYQGVERSTTPFVVQDATSLYTIFSNLGPPLDRYNRRNAMAIQGPKSGNGQSWFAYAFTPNSNAEVTKIEIGVRYVEGTDEVSISLNEEDAFGLPGEALHTWNFKNLPPDWGCCQVEVAKATKGLRVTKGLRYWLVVFTNAKTQDSHDRWMANYREEAAPICARNTGSGWFDAGGGV